MAYSLRSESAAHIALCATARRINPAHIGATFHRPAPARAMRAEPAAPISRFALVCVACIAAAIVTIL